MMSSTAHKITANSESFTPHRRALQSPCSWRRHERGLLAATTAPLLPPSFRQAHTHFPSPLHSLAGHLFSHCLSLSRIHFLTDADNSVLSLPPSPLTAHCPANKPSLFPRHRRPMPPGPVAHSSLLPPSPHCLNLSTHLDFPPSALAFPRGLLPASLQLAPPHALDVAVITDLPFPKAHFPTICNYFPCLLAYFLSPWLDYTLLRKGTLSVIFFAVSLGPSLKAGT